MHSDFGKGFPFLRKHRRNISFDLLIWLPHNSTPHFSVLAKTNINIFCIFTLSQPSIGLMRVPGQPIKKIGSWKFNSDQIMGFMYIKNLYYTCISRHTFDTYFYVTHPLGVENLATK